MDLVTEGMWEALSFSLNVLPVSPWSCPNPCRAPGIFGGMTPGLGIREGTEQRGIGLRRPCE